MEIRQLFFDKVKRKVACPCDASGAGAKPTAENFFDQGQGNYRSRQHSPSPLGQGQGLLSEQTSLVCFRNQVSESRRSSYIPAVPVQGAPFSTFSRPEAVLTWGNSGKDTSVCRCTDPARLTPLDQVVQC